MPITIQPAVLKYKNGQGTYQSADCLTADPTTIIDDTAGEGDADKVWSADKTDGEISDLKSALTHTRLNELGQYLYKKNIYFNAYLIETTLSGYDTYKIPVEKNMFIFEKWTGTTSPLGMLATNEYHYVCENTSGVLSRPLSSSEWNLDTANKYIVFIVPNDCKYLYLTIYTNVIHELSLFIDYPYPGFAEKDIHQELPCKITDVTAIKTVAYMASNGNDINNLSVGYSTYWIPVKSGDKAKITTNNISGLRFVAEYINKSTRDVTVYGPELNTSLEPVFNSDGILIVLEDQSHAGNVTLYPVNRFDVYEKQIDALEQAVDDLERDVDDLETDVRSIKAMMDGTDVTLTVGEETGYYTVVNDVITKKTPYGDWTCSKLSVEKWMSSIAYRVNSTSGFSGGIIFCGFADANNDLISKGDVSVGTYDLLIPSNAKYIYLSFYGDTYNSAYTIKAISFVTNADIDRLGIDNKYDGLTGVAFGTSLTYRAQTTGGYLQYLPDLSGITFDNQGVGSSVILGNGGSLDMLAKIKAYTGFSSKRVCLLEGFVNDWYGQKTLGTYTDTAETTVCGCVRSALNHIMSQNANLTVFLILDPYGRNYNSVDCSSTAQQNSKTQYEYYEEIAKVAESLGIPVIKEYAGSQISENTPQYFIDNIHPNALGAKQSANFIWSKMKTFVPNAVS